MNIKESDFYNFISHHFAIGSFTNDDVVSMMLPMLKIVAEIHHSGKVAKLDDLSSIYIDESHFLISKDALSIKNQKHLFEHLFQSKSQSLEITGEMHTQVQIGENVHWSASDAMLADGEDSPKNVYLKDYRCFESDFGHHDPLTDIFILGLILASVSLNLDFTHQAHLKRFVENRKQLHHINQKIHPALANIILGMTELNRIKRWKDVNEIIEKLQNYRDYNPEVEYDLSNINVEKSKNRKQIIHEKLRNRLFDNSRRNRLLYFQPNLKFLNLTVSSVPQVLNYQNIRPENLFFWNADLSKKINNSSAISLNKYLCIDDNPYIIPTLDKIRLESNKDINEYGFSQLKVSICNLNWYNTKENSTEKIISPFLLASVALSKKKGLKDQYTLEFLDSTVEVNPVLANMLKDLYDIKLPDSISLSESKLEDVYELLKKQVEKSNSGIVLDLIDKPKIKLIHSQANQILSQYNKRTKTKAALTDIRDISYSYQDENYKPRGLELFRNFILMQASSLEFLINKDIQQGPQFFNETKSISREFYQLDDGDTNPFRWEFDCCNIILGNFNYKKMSLVRDYNQIIDDKTENDVFRSLFDSLAQTSFKVKVAEEFSFKDTFNVVASDPTQNLAVKYSEAGQNYIIQGPPGTGKSQTIANLVANFVANGKKVLFVCEKRAALDVVYYRLKNQSLEQLCCLIHDSQADKKSFIMSLKETYNNFTTGKNNFTQIENTRKNIVGQIETELNTIKSFHQFMNSKIGHDNSISIKNLMDVLIASPNKSDDSYLELLDHDAGYQDWENYRNIFQRLYEINKETNNSTYFSLHPFRYLRLDVFDQYRAINDLNTQVSQVILDLETCSERLEFINFTTEKYSFGELLDTLKKAEEIFPFFDQKVEALLKSDSSIFHSFTQDLNEITRLRLEKSKLERQYPYWNAMISETDARTALGIIKKNENSFFSFFNSSFRQAKKQLLANYDVAKHTIKPALSSIVENLCFQFDITEKIENLKRECFERYKLDDIENLQSKISSYQHDDYKNVIHLIGQMSAEDRRELKEINQLLETCTSVIRSILDDYDTFPIQKIENILTEIHNFKAYYTLYATVFSDLKDCNTSIIKLLKTNKLDLGQLQVVLAEKSLKKYYDLNYPDRKHNMDILYACVQKIKKLQSDLLSINGEYIISNQKGKLNEMILKSELSTAGMSSTEKDNKKSIMDGRKILENEFSKSMRFKSIREMASSDSGQIIREIKPIWLMSPLSVSDTLPLDSRYFDVVIFDEASQITLEEGLIPIYRAGQTIIVGDEMQMPPSNFFGSSSGNQDDLWSEQSDGENEYFSLDADSFLTQGARKFPSIMLGWHYRSKSESLIGFSNASFYDNKLLTIPDMKDHNHLSDDIIVKDVADAQSNFQYIIDKPISYHYIEKGVYAGRSNEKEATYIAQIVRELLIKKTGLSIGIVAFSMEQQNEIETAINALCINDKVFENLLEEEYKREENNQFVGIFVKNLENVQGDERDIIIMSTCFGYNPNGKMLMNFGPINKRGGEKRLNVIFSRAKKSMCVVSSIKYFDIKNEYNEGANYFRKYLQYAELVSLGQSEAANNILASINNKNVVDSVHSVATQIGEELSKMGYSVVYNIGQSRFKCHIGVKKEEAGTEFILGIIIDDDAHYANNDVIEQYLLKPEILKANGWKICQVYAKDWLENRPRVLSMISTILSDESFFEDEPAETEIDIPNINVEQEDVADDLYFERFINSSNGSSKFWEICVQNNSIIVQYGKVGAKGQRMVKVFDDQSIAEYEMRRLITQKIAKGYTKEEIS